MARKTHNHQLDLPPLELECMKALWALGKGTVHDIRHWMLAERPLAYTTVMTIMDRLARRGVAEREKRGRAHLYQPVVTRRAVCDHALTRLVDRFFQGSRDELRRYLEPNGTERGEAAQPKVTEPPHLPVAREERMDPSLL
jgi:predicted transcriptional regulator